jgi:hypothetical protein
MRPSRSRAGRGRARRRRRDHHGCGDACPVFPGKRYEDWELDHPAEAESLESVRAIRDAVDVRVRQLVGELLVA